MKNDALIYALNDVDESFILSAETRKPRRTGRRIGVIALAAALAALLTLGTAMAVSEEVREAVFRLFRVEGTVDVSEVKDRLDQDKVLPPEDRTPDHSRGEFVVMEGLTAEHYRIEDCYLDRNGFFHFLDDRGRITSLVFYPKNGELCQVTDWRQVDITVKGVDVSFKWFAYDGNIFTMDRFTEFHDHENMPPFEAYSLPGIDDKIFIRVYEGKINAYQEGDPLGLPVVYDINTGEITDLFADKKWAAPEGEEEKYRRDLITFTPDLRYALIDTEALGNVSGDGLYLADLVSGERYDLRALSGMEKVSGAWLYKSQAVVCWYLSREYKYDLRVLELGSGKLLTEIRGMPMVHSERFASHYTYDLEQGFITREEFKEREYSHALGGASDLGVGEKAGLYLIEGARCAAWIDENRDVELYDLLTGQRFRVPGLRIPENMWVNLEANSAGDKLLSYDTILPDDLEPGNRNFRVLDLEAHTCTVVGVEWSGEEETMPDVGFFGGGDKVEIEVSDVDYEDGQGCYSYVYLYVLE